MGQTQMGRPLRVLAAMSGGVDSAVAAARAVDAGHEVVGVHLALSRNPATLRTGARGCCTQEDAHDARRAADILGIAFYVWDLSTQFAADVIDDFVAEYAAGRTPNPCLRCNEKIKFTALLDKATALGFDALCTGHYARIQRTSQGSAQGGSERDGQTVELHRAIDPGKDQSYVLGVLSVGQLERALFPLGDTLKADVRLEAERRGLAVADKPDSHDICFIPDGDTRGFLAQRLGGQPGQIRDQDGVLVGSHQGTYGFTVGQRKGLGISAPAPDGRPRFVLDISPVSGTVVVGPVEALDMRRVVADDARWCGAAPTAPMRVLAQVRAHGEPVPALLLVSGTAVTVELDRPLRGVAAGQALVLYDGTRVIGSATVASSTS